MDQNSIDFSKARFSADDSILNTDLAALHEARPVGDGVTVSFDSSDGGGWIVRDENGNPLPKYIVTVAEDATAARPAMVWLCYDLPDGGQTCIRVRAAGIHTHTAY